jgi:hypothetical protein
LNERGIATQVDVEFTITGEKGVKFVLVEVKFAESEFGSCKGWFDIDAPPTKNPDRTGCCRVLENPRTHCYMVTSFGRNYWDYLDSALNALGPSEPCPFRGSLYQLMRNCVSAKLWDPSGSARFGVCLHPNNRELRVLDLPVAGHEDPIAAIRAVMGNDSIFVWNARELVDSAVATKASLHSWRAWMYERYFNSHAGSV